MDRIHYAGARMLPIESMFLRDKLKEYHRRFIFLGQEDHLAIEPLVISAEFQDITRAAEPYIIKSGIHFGDTAFQ